MRTTQKQLLDTFKKLDTTLCVVEFQENGVRGTMNLGLDLLEAINKISFYLSKGKRCILLNKYGVADVERIENILGKEARKFRFITYKECLPFSCNLNNLK